MKHDVITHENSPSLHLMSGLIAFLIYALMLLLLLGGFRLYKEQVRYGENEPIMAEILSDSMIELASVESESEQMQEEKQEPLQEIQEEIKPELIPIEPVPTKEENTQPQKEVQKPKVEKPKLAEPIKEAPKEVNLADVFANVSSKTAHDIRKEEAKKRQEQLLEQKRQQEEAQRQRQAQLAQNARAIEESTKALQQATQNLQSNIKQAMTTKITLEKPKFSGNREDKAKYDKWYAEIEQILMNEWRKSGNFYQAATSAKVSIQVDAGGKLTYLFMVTSSPYTDYNSAVIAFLRKMETRLFPPPPDSSITMSITLENTLRH